MKTELEIAMERSNQTAAFQKEISTLRTQLAAERAKVAQVEQQLAGAYVIVEHYKQGCSRISEDLTTERANVALAVDLMEKLADWISPDVSAKRSVEISPTALNSMRQLLRKALDTMQSTNASVLCWRNHQTGEESVSCEICQGTGHIIISDASAKDALADIRREVARECANTAERESEDDKRERDTHEKGSMEWIRWNWRSVEAEYIADCIRAKFGVAE